MTDDILGNKINRFVRDGSDILRNYATGVCSDLK